MRTLGIAGAGRYGGLVSDLARAAGGFDRITFFDDHVAQDGTRVVGAFSDIADHIKNNSISHLAIAVGYKHFEAREAIYREHQGTIPFATLVHPSAWVSEDARLGEGAQIYSMANVETGVVMEPNVAVFNQTSITHEVHVGAHSFLSVGVSMGGGVRIGERSFIGVGANIVNDIRIGSDSVVCGGTFLSASIPDNTCVVGNPYKVIDRVRI